MIVLHDDPYLPAAPARPRLAEPELRARVAGYLACAVPMPDDYRTDGVWVWPARLAKSVLQLGVGPVRELLDHMAARSYLPPAGVAEEFWRAGNGWREASRRPPDEPAGPYYVDDSGRVWHRDRDLVLPIEPAGVAASTDPALASPLASELREVPAALAARLLDEACALRHEELLRAGAESDRGTTPAPWLARVFDGTGPDGRPWFSASRARLIEPWRRERVAAYLEAGRLAIRATGKAPDPLTDAPDPVLPLGWRTDGVWVWQEALAYYARTRGIAPELALLCHIEGCEHVERRADPPRAATSDDAVRRAAEVVRAGPRPWPSRRAWTYHRASQGHESGLLLRADAELGDVEILDADLRWRPSRVDWAALATFVEISEADAVGALEARLSVSIAGATGA
jgi:hypothetical protein